MLDTQNKKIIWKLSKRGIITNKGRSFVVTLAIILTTLVLTAVFSIGISYYESYQKQKLQSAGMDYDGEINSPSKEQVERLCSIKKIPL